MNKKTKLALVAFFIGVAVYLLLYTINEDFRIFVNQSQVNLGIWAVENKAWMYLITFLVCLLGSASIVFPIPFPTVLFVFGNMILEEYGGTEKLEIILQTPNFWWQILGFAVVGGLGCAVGEFSGYALGYGAKVVADKKQSHTFDKMEVLAKRLSEDKRKTPLIIFLFALTPLPDDILIIPLGIVKYPWYKCILPSWLGKNVTTLFYMVWPILVSLPGLLFFNDPTARALNAIDTGIYLEAIMFSISILVVVIIMSLDWQRIFERWDKKHAPKQVKSP